MFDFSGCVGSSVYVVYMMRSVQDGPRFVLRTVVSTYHLSQRGEGATCTGPRGRGCTCSCT
jgi:hypothetical protein